MPFYFYCNDCLAPCRCHDSELCAGCRERRADSIAAEEADFAFDLIESSEGGAMPARA